MYRVVGKSPASRHLRKATVSIVRCGKAVPDAQQIWIGLATRRLALSVAHVPHDVTGKLSGGPPVVFRASP